MSQTEFCPEHHIRMKRSPSHRAFALTAYLALISVALVILTLLIWAVYPYSIIEYTPEDEYNIVYGVAEGNVVEQGGVIAYEFDYVKYTDVVPEVSKRFVDGLVFNAAEGGVGLPAGEGHAVIETAIPKTLPPGTYQLEIVRKFHMNPIRVITITDVTEEFTVIASEK